MIVAALLVLASTFQAQGSSTPLFPQARPSNDPFTRLFRPNIVPAAPDGVQPFAPAERHHRRDRPKVVCGMTLIPADPRIDPQILHEPPDTATKFAIRKVEPKICRP